MKARHLTFSVVMAAVGLATLPACNTIDDASEAYGQQTQNLNATGGTVWIFESEDPESGIWPAAIYAEGDPSTLIAVTRVTLGDHLEPGDTVLLRGGYYRDTETRENVNLFYDLVGTAELPITIKSYPGETAIFDPGYPEFRSPGAWRPATSADLATGEPHPEEWVSNATYGHCAATDPTLRPGCCDNADGCTYEHPHYAGVGDFLGGRLWGQMLDRQQRLMTYTNFGDMRADNESLARAPLDDPRPGVGPLYRG